MAREKDENPKSEKLPTDRLKMEIDIEELEPIVAPGERFNSNETQVVDPEDRELSLEIEELEPIVAPGLKYNSNETLVTDPGEE